MIMTMNIPTPDPNPDPNPNLNSDPDPDPDQGLQHIFGGFVREVVRHSVNRDQEGGHVAMEMLDEALRMRHTGWDRHFDRVSRGGVQWLDEFNVLFGELEVGVSD